MCGSKAAGLYLAGYNVFGEQELLFLVSSAHKQEKQTNKQTSTSISFTKREMMFTQHIKKMTCFTAVKDFNHSVVGQ